MRQRPPAASHVSVPSSYLVEDTMCVWQYGHTILTGASPNNTLTTTVWGCVMIVAVVAGWPGCGIGCEGG